MFRAPQTRGAAGEATAPVRYEDVRAVLRADAHGLFRRTTLRAEIGPFEIGVDVKIRLGRATEEISAQGERIMRVELSWAAAERAAMFPTMDAVLLARPLSSGETRLELEGRYRPPLGAAGGAFDALVGHRIAEACVRRFVADVARQLGDEHGGRASAQTHL